MSIFDKQLDNLKALVKSGEQLTGLKRLSCGCVVDPTLNNIIIEACKKHKLSEIP